MYEFPLLQAVFQGNTYRSKRIKYIETGHSCEPSVNSDSRLASFMSSTLMAILYASPSGCNSTEATDLGERFTKYILIVLQKTHISSSAVLLSLCYSSRRGERYSCPIELFKSWTAALMLADSYLNDNAFSARSWATVTGLPKAEIARMKRHALCALDFSLHTSVQEYTQFLGSLERHLQTRVMRTLSLRDKMGVVLQGKMFDNGQGKDASVTPSFQLQSKRLS
ncbi:MAG: hypothetical protein SGCHY_002625 [Lobulomycetales sp.]